MKEALDSRTCGDMLDEGVYLICRATEETGGGGPCPGGGSTGGAATSAGREGQRRCGFQCWSVCLCCGAYGFMVIFEQQCLCAGDRMNSTHLLLVQLAMND